jgi:probable HAF family extracellular repeat protein
MKRFIVVLVVLGIWFAAPAVGPASEYRVIDLGTLGGTWVEAWDINASGQVVGDSSIPGDTAEHAFRTGPGMPINPATDDLGILGGTGSQAWGINASGQVVGGPDPDNFRHQHAFRTGPGMPITPATDDLAPSAGRGAGPMASTTAGRSWVVPLSPTTLTPLTSTPSARRRECPSTPPPTTWAPSD